MNGQGETMTRIEELEKRVSNFKIEHHLSHPLWKENPEEAYQRFSSEISEFKALISELWKALDFYSSRTTVNELAIQHRVLTQLLPLHHINRVKVGYEHPRKRS